MRKRVLLTLLLLGGFPHLAGAVVPADGDPCDAAQFQSSGGGYMVPIWCVILLNDKTSASGVPVDFDLGKTPTKGLADVIQFQRGTDDDCAAGTVTFTSSLTQNGTAATIAGAPTLDVTSGGAGTAIINVEQLSAPLGRWIHSSWSGVAGCTGGFDALMIGYEWKR